MTDFDYMKPDYDAIIRERIVRIERIRATEGMKEGLWEFYKDKPADFISDWGMTFDPRNAEIGLPTTIPFVLFERQVEFIEYLHRKWLAREDGLAEKSRDMGVSWLCVAFGVWMWIFHDGTVVGYGSRKEEYVDKIGDPKSLFWKARQFISFLPPEFTPVGYSEKRHAPHMRIINPANGASIIGEAGDNIGRGNRTSIYFKDESAFYEHADAIDAALSQTSNCKVDVSTPNGVGNPFYRKRHGGKLEIFTFHWTQDPRKDINWYNKQKSNADDPVIVAQEIDIDYNASTTNSYISGTLVQDGQNTGVAQIEAIGGWVVGIDAAHEGDDESILHFRKGRLNLPQLPFQGIDGIQLAGEVEHELDNLLCHGDKLAGIIIELDGPGVSCYDQLRAGKYGKYLHGVHTGARLSDDRHYNIRARMWADARTYLKQPPVSIPNCRKLHMQLSSLKYKYKDGVLLMQSKKEYKGEYGKSPDRADAFVLTFAEPNLQPPVEEAKEDWRQKFKHKMKRGRTSAMAA